MRESEYEIFITSNYWKGECEEVKKLYKTCVICDSKEDLEVHCRDFRRIRRPDIHKDLTLLCNDCLWRQVRYLNKGKKLDRPKKKKVLDRRKEQITRTNAYLWQQTQNRFNEIKRKQKKKHLVQVNGKSWFYRTKSGKRNVKKLKVRSGIQKKSPHIRRKNSK